MIKNIFFDLDGTIIDSAPGIIKALRYTYHQAALSVPDDSVLRKFIGPPLLESIEKYTKISPESELARQLLRGFQEYYGRSGWQEMRLYPQIVPVLKQLQQSGHRIYIATAKPQTFAKQIVDYLKIQQYFVNLYGTDLDEKMQKKDVIQRALKTEAISDPQQIVMVGDRDTDVLGAAANQVATIGVLYGFGTAMELTQAGAKALIKTPEQLIEQVS